MSQYSESLISYEKEKDSPHKDDKGVSRSEIKIMMESEFQFYAAKIVNFEKEQYDLKAKNDELVEKVTDLENQLDNHNLTIGALEEKIEILTIENEKQRVHTDHTKLALEVFMDEQKHKFKREHDALLKNIRKEKESRTTFGCLKSAIINMFFIVCCHRHCHYHCHCCRYFD